MNVEQLIEEVQQQGSVSFFFYEEDMQPNAPTPGGSRLAAEIGRDHPLIAIRPIEGNGWGGVKFILKDDAWKRKQYLSGLSSMDKFWYKKMLAKGIITDESPAEEVEFMLGRYALLRRLSHPIYLEIKEKFFPEPEIPGLSKTSQYYYSLRATWRRFEEEFSSWAENVLLNQLRDYGRNTDLSEAEIARDIRVTYKSIAGRCVGKES